MRRILVPVDFSTTSKKAARFAVDLASKTDGVVLLVHLFSPKKKIAFGSAETIGEMNKRTEANLLKRLARLKKKLLEESGANMVISTHTGHTPVVNNLLDFAGHNHIDMIVMGTQGASGLKKVLIGSVAARIMTEADLPVILIPEKFEMKEIKQVVFTTDIKKTDRRALPIVCDFACLLDSKLTIVHVFQKLPENDQEGEAIFKTYANRVKKAYDISNLQFKQIETTDVDKTLANLSAELHYDVLAMAKRKLEPVERFFQKSFTKEKAFMTTRPLLVVPERA